MDALGSICYLTLDVAHDRWPVACDAPVRLVLRQSLHVEPHELREVFAASHAAKAVRVHPRCKCSGDFLAVLHLSVTDQVHQAWHEQIGQVVVNGRVAEDAVDRLPVLRRFLPHILMGEHVHRGAVDVVTSGPKPNRHRDLFAHEDVRQERVERHALRQGTVREEETGRHEARMSWPRRILTDCPPHRTREAHGLLLLACRPTR
mmetsp:Transcript_55610/g.154960  ORF Transcript_55610/g.154960 Transcript_55610/m.154960 type:complete len:204 (+) Transcript_55610:128-739(+)